MALAPPDWHATPDQMLTLLGSGFTIRDLTASPRVLPQNEEATLFALSGLLQMELRVYNVVGTDHEIPHSGSPEPSRPVPRPLPIGGICGLSL